MVIKEELLQWINETVKSNYFSFAENKFDANSLTQKITETCDFYDFVEGDIRVFKDGKPVNDVMFLTPKIEGNYVNRRVEKYMLKKLLFDKHTIIYEALHKKVPLLRNICDQISDHLRCHCWVNGYLTPPNSYGFSEHSDPHTVIVFQLIGKKDWRVNDRSCGISAGDILVIPEGMPHSAKCDDSYSFHLTIGIKPISMIDILAHINSKKMILNSKFEANNIFNYNVLVDNYLSSIEHFEIEAAVSSLLHRPDGSVFSVIEKIKRIEENVQIKITGLYRYYISSDAVVLSSKENKSDSL